MSFGRRPLFLLFGASILVLLLLQTVIEYRNVLLDDYAQHILEREGELKSAVKLAHSTFSPERIDSIKTLLDEGRSRRHFDYYIIQFQGEPLAWGTASGSPDSVNHEFKIFDELQIFEDKSFLVSRLNDDFTLMVGINKSVDEYLAESYRTVWRRMLQSQSIAIVIVIFVLLYFIRDIIAAIKMLGSRANRDFSKIKTKSKEASILVGGFSAYQKQVSSLSNAADAFATHLLPSIKEEIASGQTPPYSFACTMVRVDINGFSEIFNKFDTETFLDVINRFFTEASYTIAVYRGLVHEYAGDEVIFYFKDQHSRNSSIIAISAICEIQQIAERFNNLTMREYGYPFVIKSSLSHGEVMFRPLVDGNTVAGDILIKTKRLLAEVQEKQKNTVLFAEDVAQRISDFCKVQQLYSKTLRGYAKETMIYCLEHRPSLLSLLENLNEEQIEVLGYFRSSDDICTILDFLRHNKSLSTDLRSRVIHSLRSLKCVRTDDLVAEKLFTLIDDLASDKSDWRSLASLVMATTNLMNTEQIKGRYQEQLLKLLKINDRRVTSNVLEVFTLFGIKSDDPSIEQLISSEDNRVSANAFVYEGATKEISRSALKQLKKNLKSSSETHRASALYALGEIISQLTKHDVVYLKSHPGIQELIADIPRHISDSSAMVRRQALIAARKTRSEELKSKILKISRSLEHTDLENEIVTYLIDTAERAS